MIVEKAVSIRSAIRVAKSARPYCPRNEPQKETLCHPARILAFPVVWYGQAGHETLVGRMARRPPEGVLNPKSPNLASKCFVADIRFVRIPIRADTGSYFTTRQSQ